MSALVNMFENFFQGLFDLVKSFFSLVQVVLESAASFVTGVFNFILSLFSSVLNIFKDAGAFVLANAAVILILALGIVGYQFYRASYQSGQSQPLKSKSS